jgi:hypothetical protein
MAGQGAGIAGRSGGRWLGEAALLFDWPEPASLLKGQSRSGNHNTALFQEIKGEQILRPYCHGAVPGFAEAKESLAALAPA